MKSKEQNGINHIAFIMDGNGRWAQKRLLTRNAGHKKGVETISKVISAVYAEGIDCVTLYAFSTENKNRPQKEIDGLFDLMQRYFDEELNNFIKKEIKLTFMGDLSYFPKNLQEIVRISREKTAHFNGKILNFALNYGGRNEIVRAANLILKSGYSSIDENKFNSFLYTAALPEVDIIVRTGGEKRLSNFLLYQSAYSELFFTDKLWPDFDEKDVKEIVDEFYCRNRRFGKV